tara:strand:- start:1653 stop:2186 length:534 start_codon:yes stop_codon:yes gene_type:complete
MKTNLIKIYPDSLLQNLETVCFNGELPFSFHNFATQEQQSKNQFESFHTRFEILSKYFNQYEELLKITDNFYKNLGMQTDIKKSKILFYPSGYDGTVHYDCPPDNKELVTTITFLNTDWGYNFGGEILVYDDNYRIIDGTVPIFGASFIFRSYLKHRAVAPVRLSSLVRCVLVTKSK